MTDEMVSARFNLGALMERYGIKAQEIADRIGKSADTVRRWAKKTSPPMRQFSRDVQLQLAEAITAAAREHGHEVTHTAEDLVTFEANQAVVDEVRAAQQQLFRPGWMSVADWLEFKRRWQREDGSFRCELTAQMWAGQDFDFTWEMLPTANTFDHIIPKEKGGTDHIDNLRPAFKSMNSSRQNESEAWYRERSEFFDAPFTEAQLSAIRASQLECGINAVKDLAELFKQPRMNVTGNMFIQNMCVRSGKFLTGAVVMPRAINQILIEQFGPEAHRIKTVLILTKEEALRDQFVSEAGSEPVRYGIHSINPRVGVLDNSEKSRKTRIEPALIRERYDIVIGCLQTFFTENGVPKPEMFEMLRAYDAVVIDEPQFAEDQWKGLLVHTSHALVFGMTGTPLKPTATVSRRVVKDENGNDRIELDYGIHCLKGDDRGGVYLLSSWTANHSDQLDHNLKHIPHLQEKRDQLVTNAGDDGFVSDVLGTDGRQKTLNNRGNSNDAVHYALVVARHAIQAPGDSLWTRDRFWRNRHQASGPLGEMTPIRAAQTRDGVGYSPELSYPPHLIVTCRGIYTCERVVEELQKELDASPTMQREDGWQVVACHSGNLNSAKNRKRREQLLAEIDQSDPDAVRTVEEQLRQEGIYAPKPLTIPVDPAAEPDKVHPFMRGWLVHRGQAMDDRCARILVVDGMCKEGLNNPLILGVAQGSRVSFAIVELIQRMARSLAAVIDTKEMKCCPAELDEPFFVTHAVFDTPCEDEEEDGTVVQQLELLEPGDAPEMDRSTASMMRLALNYLRRSEDYTRDIPGAKDLLEGILAGGDVKPQQPSDPLPHQRRVEVVREVGKIRQEQDIPDDAPIDPAPVIDRIRECMRDQPTAVVEKAVELGKEIAENPTVVRATNRVFRKPSMIGPPILAEETTTSLADPIKALIAHAYTHMTGDVEAYREAGKELSQALEDGDLGAVISVGESLKRHEAQHRHFRRAGRIHASLPAIVNEIVYDARIALGLTFDYEEQLKNTIVRVEKAPEFTKTGRRSTAKDRVVNGIGRMYELANVTIKSMVGCPQTWMAGGRDAGWRDGGRYDCPGVHDLLRSHRGAVIQAVERTWLEKLEVDIEPLTQTRKGMGVSVDAPPQVAEDPLDF
jgi:HNH endonuclease